MRKPRFTFKNAFHHVMNRGHNKSIIFPESVDKNFFISLLHKKSKFFKIKIFAYCIMDNHYHIILQNSSEKLADFMRQLNGIYATYFRKKYGGVGYVFQNRYKSTLIQDEKYLQTAILYTLLNPVRAKIAQNALLYQWSSINEYFNKSSNNITDSYFVEELFGSSKIFFSLLNSNIPLVEKNSPIGKYIGEKNYIDNYIILNKNRRRKCKVSPVRQRKNEYNFRAPNIVINKFLIDKNINIESLKQNKLKIKRLRHALLVKLREECCMKYREINKLPIFNKYQLSSLRSIYYIYNKSLCF